MTKLADELEACPTLVTSTTDILLPLRTALNTGAGLDDPATVYEFQCLLDRVDPTRNTRQPVADEAMALRQPDAVPGDLAILVEQMLSLAKHGGVNREWCSDAAAAIQSLTAERDAALVRVAELEAGLAAINAGALNDRENDKNFRYFAERKTRALLEGSKP